MDFPCGHTFLTHYCTPWPVAEPRYQFHLSAGTRVQYHLRSFIVVRNPDTVSWVPADSGLRCSIQSGALAFSDQHLNFTEHRISVAFYAQWNGEWNIVVLQPDAKFHASLSAEEYPIHYDPTLVGKRVMLDAVLRGEIDA